MQVRRVQSYNIVRGISSLLVGNAEKKIQESELARFIPAYSIEDLKVKYESVLLTRNFQSHQIVNLQGPPYEPPRVAKDCHQPGNSNRRPSHRLGTKKAGTIFPTFSEPKRKAKSTLSREPALITIRSQLQQDEETRVCRDQKARELSFQRKQQAAAKLRKLGLKQDLLKARKNNKELQLTYDYNGELINVQKPTKDLKPINLQLESQVRPAPVQSLPEKGKLKKQNIITLQSRLKNSNVAETAVDFYLFEDAVPVDGSTLVFKNKKKLGPRPFKGDGSFLLRPGSQSRTIQMRDYLQAIQRGHLRADSAQKYLLPRFKDQSNMFGMLFAEMKEEMAKGGREAGQDKIVLGMKDFILDSLKVEEDNCRKFLQEEKDFEVVEKPTKMDEFNLGLNKNNAAMLLRQMQGSRMGVRPPCYRKLGGRNCSRAGP